MITGTCPKSWIDTGVWRMLSNLEHVVPSLYKFCPGTVPPVPDGQRGGLILLAGYSPTDQLWTALKQKGMSLGVLYCSDILQAYIVPQTNPLVGDLAPLLHYIELLERDQLDYLFVTSQSLCNVLRDGRSDTLSDRIIYLPVALNASEPALSHVGEFNARDKISILGTRDWHRNLAVQFAALNLYKMWSKEDKTRILLNGTEKVPVIQFFKQLFPRLRNDVYCPFEAALRVNRTAFLEELGRVKVNLAVSLSETFGYLVWELAMLGIPSIVSPTIWWYRGDPSLSSYDLIDKLCVVQDVSNYHEIGERLHRIMTLPDAAYAELGYVSRQIAIKVAFESSKAIESTLLGIAVKHRS